MLGILADHFGIVFVYKLCAFLSLLGVFAAFLPDVRPPGREVETIESLASPVALL